MTTNHGADVHPSTVERRRRIGVLHRIDPTHRSDDVVDATGSVLAMHATDPASVYLGLLARTKAVTVDEIDAALYEQRSIVRILAMRRTLFVVRAEDAGVPAAACSLRVASTQRATLAMQLERGSAVTDPVPWIDRAMDAAETVLRELGASTAQDITAAEPLLATRWNPAPGSKYGGESPVTSRILSQLDMEGRIERCRPTGASFTSTRYRWRVVDPPLSAAAHELGETEGRRRLVDAWLTRFGPATEADIVWWTGLTKTHIRTAIASIDTEPVELDGGDGFRRTADTMAGNTMAGDVAGDRWVAMLPGLDPTSMGWRDRDWYLEPGMVGELFDRAGNVGPTIWADGRIVGGWAQTPDGRITAEYLTDVDGITRELVAIECERISDFLGDIRVIPRFRVPLERRLADS